MEAALAQIHPALAQLRPGQRFEGRYACLAKDRLTSRNGSAYLSLRAPRPRAGSSPPGSSATPTGSGCGSSAATRCSSAARSERFRGELVAELDRRAPARAGELRPGGVPPGGLPLGRGARGLPRAPDPRGPRPGAARASSRRSSSTGRLAAEFRRAPCTRGGHHAYLGGLIEHTVAVGTLVGELCQLHPRLDSDLLMAAAILHDVGKTREFTYGAEFGDQRRGRACSATSRSAPRSSATAASSSSPTERRAGAAPLRPLPPRARRGPGARTSRQGGRGFGSAEALALYRLNALDASVKGALGARASRSSGPGRLR